MTQGDFSRFGRNSLETGYFIERVFPLFHTRFISVSDDFDSSRFKGDTGGMDVAFKYLISEYYSRDMSLKTRSAKYAKMERGEYQSAICPYGYRKSADGRMEPDPEAAAVVKQIFALASGGMSAAKIAAVLSRQGTPTPGEYKAAHGNKTHDISRTHGIWCNSTVLRILDDERYTGTYIMGKRTVVEVGATRNRMKDRQQWFVLPDHHAPLVDKTVFEQAQSFRVRFSIPNRKERKYPLRGKVVCGCCDHALKRISQTAPRYVCRHSQSDARFQCHGLQVQASVLEQAVFETLKGQMDAYFSSDRDVAAAVDSAVPGLAEYDRQIEKIQDDKRHLYEKYLLGEVDLDTYRADRVVCDELLLKIKNARAVLSAQVKRKQEVWEQQQTRQRVMQELSRADRLTDSLAELLIDKVYVFSDSRIEIAYKMQDIFA